MNAAWLGRVAQSSDVQTNNSDAERLDRRLRVQIPSESGKPLRSQRSQRGERCCLCAGSEKRVSKFFEVRGSFHARASLKLLLSRSITEPNMRARSASHRDIPRGRSERRDILHLSDTVRGSSQRTRSLTREEASNREAMALYERAASSQRLAPGPPTRPSRADSRVTFALDTTSRERGDEPRRQWSKELLPQPGDIEIMGES